MKTTNTLSALLSVLCLVGCGEGRAPVPALNPGTAADQAMREFDANADGTLSKEELAACPGMLGALSTYDANRDGKVSRDEIAERLQSWYAKKVALFSFRPAVTYQGKPLGNAQVVLTPEKFLGGAIKTASGTTDAAGLVALQVDDAALSGGLQVLQPGLYRVEIKHPAKAIHAKYAASLGIEAAPDHLVGKNITFEVGP